MKSNQIFTPPQVKAMARWVACEDDVTMPALVDVEGNDEDENILVRQGDSSVVVTADGELRDEV